jgi:hypothetical protein
MIRVIKLSSDERKQQTVELFYKIKPYLDEGLSYNKAFKSAGLMSARSWRSRAYTREVVEYAKSMGYD